MGSHRATCSMGLSKSQQAALNLGRRSLPLRAQEMSEQLPISKRNLLGNSRFHTPSFAKPGRVADVPRAVQVAQALPHNLETRLQDVLNQLVQGGGHETRGHRALLELLDKPLDGVHATQRRKSRDLRHSGYMQKMSGRELDLFVIIRFYYDS